MCAIPGVCHEGGGNDNRTYAGSLHYYPKRAEWGRENH